MNRQQKKLVANVVTVITFTVALVVGFANIKNAINRSEAVRAMNILSDEIFKHKKEYGSLPSTIYVTQYIDRIGAVRLGNLQYRAQWIGFDSDLNTTILAYSQRNYRGLVKAGYIVLWLNGKVEWLGKKQFEQILASQQKQRELQWLQEHLQKE
ncbi:MAG: hypothetical protein KJ757_03210 [Planctomycetes bacterium]|nr:hypothetical protein [Planctomycetota bacterium]MBU1518194.1 hypothetical protein [Planctomycetota bacterium]MBU2458679.1 hypothetical protein [Planctomycetota bacterium]MBU2596559.1 hypothetical protein [Planctomycetota bacterium]